jgi:hypothetical protein
MPVINGALRTIKKSYLETSVAPRPPVSHRTTGDHTNQHCMHHS